MLADCATPATTDAWPSSRTTLTDLAVNGKILRGRTTDSTVVRLLAATDAAARSPPAPCG
ncbi:hypothetical protein GBF35_46020 [Nonomuraea phyllanthi]|uniref:hypothetical protein n=1 Tax=Nonomuraea phyllanthi TaxID=2219224 RepID=UPI0012933AF8|nr:hypothetical protein [Nonomuraea phyllanthi]QFY12947.1 hypothetical protein GBF35_46020 [Nonomuraea phyllanthi]